MHNTVGEDIKAILSRPAVTLVILLLISLGICGLYANEKENGPLHLLQSACQTFLAPISRLSVCADNKLTTLSDYIFEQTTSSDSIAELKAENAKLKSQVISNEKYKNEAERLQKLLNIKDQYKTDGVSAHVIGRSNSAWNQTITISVGYEDGISAGMTVIGKSGVVGQVISVNPNSSQVRLLEDPNSGVAVKILSNNSDCILQGSLDGVLYLEGLDLNANAKVGDFVVSSGLGGSFVEGLTIGTISQIISTQSGANRKIVVSPLDQNSSLSEVLVIKEAK